VSNGQHDPFAYLTPGRFCAGLGLVLFLIYPDVFLGQATFVFRDFSSFGYPLAFYHKQSFWRGEIPLWNPLSHCGQPFLAQWLTLVLYPGSLLYLLFPLPSSLPVFCLLHQLLGGVGMYCLAWKWTRHRLGAALAGLAFAFNGLTQNCLMWPSHIAGLGWLPWVIYLAEDGWRQGQRRLAAAIGVGGMQMLTGAPEFIVLTWVFVGALALVDFWNRASDRVRAPRRFLVLVAGVALLAAAQLLPFLTLLAHSQRDLGYGDSHWAMPGTGWGNLLVPHFQCFKDMGGFYFHQTQHWISSYYPGITALGFAILAVCLVKERKVRLLALFLGLALVLALGDQGYLYPALKKLVPQMGFMRFPIKFVTWLALSVPLLAAYGMSETLRPQPRKPGGSLRALGLLGIGLTLGIVALVTFSWCYPALAENRANTALNGLTRGLFWWVIVGGVTWLSRRAVGRISLLGGVLLLLAVGLDLLTAESMRLTTGPPEVLAPNRLELQPRPRPGDMRAMTSFWAYMQFITNANFRGADGFQLSRAGLSANCNLLEDIPKADGFLPLVLRDAQAIWALLFFQVSEPRAAVILNEMERPPDYRALLDFMCVAYVSMPKRAYEWMPRTNALPLVTAGQQPRFGDDLTVLRALVDTSFDPRRIVYLPLENREVAPAAGETRVQLGSAQFAPHRIDVEVAAEGPAWVVIAQSYDPVWRAFCDGVETPLLRANAAFQSVAVPAGRHQLSLRYRDRRFEAGLWVSLLTLGVCLGSGWWVVPRCS
jgi:hypothetical protein